MKHTLLTVLGVSIALITTTLAVDKTFPEEGGQKFTVTVPDNWVCEVDSDGVLTAESPDEDVALVAWAADDAEMADFKNPAPNLDHILRDCVKGIRLKGEPKKMMVGKSHAWVFEGAGTDVDDSTPVLFQAMILVTGPTDATVLCLEADRKAKATHIAGMDKILASVRSL